MRVQPSDRIGGASKSRSAAARSSKRSPHRSGQRRPSPLASISKRLFQLALVVGLLSICIVLPLRWLNPPTTAFMLQDPLYQQSPVLHWATWKDLGSTLPLAVVAAEDQNFASHDGFDFDSIEAVLREREQGERLRGASTISQQVAKNLYLWPGKNMLRKGLEAYLTVLIELTWPKQRILEVYLNVAELGPGVYGVGQASTRYYNKAPDELTSGDAALLAAVLPNPKRLLAAAPSDYVQQRAEWIERQMDRLSKEQWLAQL